jgi:4-carboxymuconolactone decarboxylase
MSEQEPRIPPLKRSEWTEEVRDLFAVMDGPEGREKGPSREIMHFLAQHPVLSERFMAFGRHILFESILSDRVRELVTLYIAWTTKSDYEWVSHVAFGLHIGLTEADIEAVKEGPDSPHWSDFDRNLLRAVDQLRDGYNLDDALWAALSKEFDRSEMMELVYTIGNYLLFSAVLNSFRIPLEPGTEDVVKKYGTP